MTSESAISIHASVAVHVCGLLAAFAITRSIPEVQNLHTHSQRGSIELQGSFAEPAPEQPQFVSLAPVWEKRERITVRAAVDVLAPKAMTMRRQSAAEPVSALAVKLPAALDDCECEAPEHEIKTPKWELEAAPELVAALEPPTLRRQEIEPQPTVETAVELPVPQSQPGTDFDVPPKSLFSNLQPPYPEDARQRMQTGKVVLAVRISADGTVTDVQVVQSSGVESLDRAALAAVAKWRFHAAMRAGRPVESLVNVPVNFRKSW
jgi:protein TonB